MSDRSIDAATSDLLRLAVEVEEQAHPLQQALQTILRATGSREGLIAELPWCDDRHPRLQPVATLRLCPGSPPSRELSPPWSRADGLTLQLPHLENGAVVEAPLERFLAPPHPEAPARPLIAYVFGRENTGRYLLALDRHPGSVGLADHHTASRLFQALETLLHSWKLSSLRASADALLEQALARDTEADTGTHHLLHHLRQGVIQLDVNGYVEFISQPALRLLGVGAPGAAGQTHFSALLSGACHLFAPHSSGLPDHLRWIFEQRTLPTVDSIPERFVLHRDQGADLCMEKVQHPEGFLGLILSPCTPEDERDARPDNVRRFEAIISRHDRPTDASQQDAEERLAAVARHFLDPIRHLHQQAASLLDPALAQETARAEVLSKIASTAAHLSELINDVVDYHLVARSPVHAETVDLEALVRLTTQNVFPDLSPGALIIGHLPAVRADPNLLIRALSHLIHFARDHRKPEEPLRLRIGFSHSQQSFVLSDNGTGLDMRLVNRLVNEPLADTHPLDSAPVQSGRSLAVARKIIHMHGGAFEVISMRGVGTTCYFQLPLAVNLETSF